jgi:hypothetical protein
MPPSLACGPSDPKRSEVGGVPAEQFGLVVYSSKRTDAVELRFENVGGGVAG